MSLPRPRALVERLRHRKLAQWSLAYLAGAWVALQLFTTLSQNFAWPPVVIRVITVALGFGLLPVLVLAYYHGERGEQRVGGMELLILTGLLALGGGVLALTGASARGAPGGGDTSGLAGGSAGVGGIAVLPFENLSSNTENAYFADGMMEDILTRLSQIQNLRVISRTSVEGYRETTKPLKLIGQELGAEHLVEGSVRREGTRVRIAAKLIRASTDQSLWSATFDRDLTDVFAVQSEISQSIAEALRIQLSQGQQARLERKPTENLEAYDLFLRGREVFGRLTRDDNERAIRIFRQALDLDPSFHLAAAELARSYTLRYRDFGFGPEWADSGLFLARRTVARQPDAAEVHHSLGVALNARGEDELAAASYHRALELNPSLGASNTNLAAYAASRSDFVDALQWYTRAMRIEPTFFVPHRGLVTAQVRIGDLDRAERTLLAYTQRFPDRERERLLLAAYLALARGERQQVLRLARAAEALPPTRGDDVVFGRLLLYAGYVGEAAPWLERAFAQVSPHRVAREQYTIPLLGYVRSRSGDQAGADSLFALIHSRRDSLRPGLRGRDEYRLAMTAGARGNQAEALVWLERAVRAGWADWVLDWHNPMFSGLRGHPRYEAVMAEARSNVDRQRAEAKRLGL